METQESNNNNNNNDTKLIAFSQDESTNSNINQINDKKSDNVLNKDVVTRPLLWGLVTFLVFFALVIGAVSLYRMYNSESSLQQLDSSSSANTPLNTKDDAASAINTPVTSNTNKEASVIEEELKSIDSDLESDVYSDAALGL